VKDEEDKDKKEEGEEGEEEDVEGLMRWGQRHLVFLSSSTTIIVSR